MTNKHSLWNRIDTKKDAEYFNKEEAIEAELKLMRKHAGLESPQEEVA